MIAELAMSMYVIAPVGSRQPGMLGSQI